MAQTTSQNQRETTRAIEVPSFTSQGPTYTVTVSEAGATCTCPDFQHRSYEPGYRCKHIRTRVLIATIAFQQIRPRYRFTYELDGKTVKAPHHTLEAADSLEGIMNRIEAMEKCLEQTAPGQFLVQVIDCTGVLSQDMAVAA